MKLTLAQKSFIKKNIKSQSAEKISKYLNIAEDEVLNYLKNKWGEEKYNRLIKSNIDKENQKKLSLNFKSFLKNNWLQLLFLTALVFIAYVNSLGNAFVSDDIGGILKKNEIRSFSWVIGEFRAFIQPLIYFLTYKIFGPNPIVYRLINIFFHLGTVYLIYIILLIMTNKKTAFFAASIFAVHPILVESVGWISGGNYVRGGFFFLISLILYILSSNNRKFYFVSIIFYVLALFSIDKAIALAPIFLLYELSKSSLTKNWQKTVPFIGFTCIWALFYIAHIGERISALQLNYAQEAGMNNPFVQVPVSISSYLSLIFWPDKLTLYHSELFFTGIEYAIMLTIVILFISWIIYSFFKNKLIFFWLTFFIVTFSYSLTPLRIASIVAERYVYMGSLGVIFAVSYYLNILTENKRTKLLAYIIFSIILIVFTMRTISRNVDWKNEDNLWLSAVRTSPSSPNNHNNLGDYYGRHGDFIKARGEFIKAIQLSPRYADAYHNLANSYIQMNDINTGLKYYEKAVEYNPTLWQSYQNIGVINYRNGQYDKALENMKKALDLSPNNDLLNFAMGVIYLKKNDKKNAIKFFNQTLLLNPKNEQAKAGLIDVAKLK